MKIEVVTPTPPGSNTGNRVTANRWASILRELGHQVRVSQTYGRGNIDMLVAIHAIRSAGSIQEFKNKYPLRPVVVLLAGTDVYGPLYEDLGGQLSVSLADRLVTLQRLALSELRGPDRAKARVIVQSATPASGPGPNPSARHFRVVVVGNLRPVKDPFRTALASQYVPLRSRLRVLQVGHALDPAMGRQANKSQINNPRYRWLGALPRWKARQIMKQAHLAVVSSLSEGGANVISEAVADAIPILASRMPGNVGLLGDNYPGYFPLKGTVELATLLSHAEANLGYRTALVDAAAHLRPLVAPAYEREQWRKLIGEIAG